MYTQSKYPYDEGAVQWLQGGVPKSGGGAQRLGSYLHTHENSLSLSPFVTNVFYIPHALMTNNKNFMLLPSDKSERGKLLFRLFQQISPEKQKSACRLVETSTHTHTGQPPGFPIFTISNFSCSLLLVFQTRPMLRSTMGHRLFYVTQTRLRRGTYVWTPNSTHQRLWLAVLFFRGKAGQLLSCALRYPMSSYACRVSPPKN